MIRLNRTQRLVLGFFALAWASLVAMLTTAPQLSAQVLGLPGGSGADEVDYVLILGEQHAGS